MILQLNNNILKRFEHNLFDGVLILYNVRTKDIWFGNGSSNEFIKLINGQREMKDICDEVHSHFQEYTREELNKSIHALTEELLEKNFLMICKT